MSRVLPRRRSRGRESPTRDGRSAHRPAYVETEDQDAGSPPAAAPLPAVVPVGPEQAGRIVGADAIAPAAEGPTVHVETPEPADPDLPVLSAAAELSRQGEKRPVGFLERHRLLVAGGWSVVVLLGLALLLLALAGTGPAYLDEVGSVIVLTAYSWALAARAGGRPVVFGAVAALASVGVLLSEQPFLRTGAAVMTCAITATLAVVVTVPATRFLRVVQECVLAVGLASVGALAVLGFSPTISLVRFEYATLALSLVGAFGVVYRLGAGLHGLGRRGVVAVLVGGGVLLVTLVYAEALRRWGPPGLVDSLLDVVRWSRAHLGAFPRPVETVLGIPALAWGVHLRARRRQGWWVCAFGAAGTSVVASSLVNPAITLRECGLSVVYGLVVGLAIGWLVIRVDLALSGSGAGGRRSEEHAAARPEPARTASLL